MKLAVCGCSWSSRDSKNPNFEFGQIVADYFGFDEYKNYAVEGVSNFVIALQIDQCLRDFDPDFLIINATTVTRDDLKINNSGRYNSLKLFDNLNDTLYSNSFGSIFDDDLTKNLDDIWNADTLEPVFDTQEKHTLYKKWFLNFYDADIQKHKQHLILQSLLYKLQFLGKKFVFSPNTFEWAEAYDLKTKDETLNFTVDGTEQKWAIPESSLLPRGVSDYLEVDDIIYGGWDKSPGTIMSSHISPESHQAFAADVINHIELANLINKL